MLASRLNDRANASFKVSSVERKPYRRSPYAPFRTTTLQQEGSRKLGFSTKYTMSVAQRLYENGYITYMRTDSIQLSQTAIDAARSQARELYGAEYVPDAPRTYTSKVKNAQEAHEAIRPAGDRFRTPAEAQRSGLKGDELRLYDLIWKRTVACQMKDATGESVSVRVQGTPGEIQDQSLERTVGSTADGRSFDPAAVRTTEFGASGKVINFYGFLKAYVESNDDQSIDRDDQERRLPPLAERDPLSALRINDGRPRHQAAGPLHRGEPDQGAGRPGDRPPVHLRDDHRHDPRPRLRLQEGHRARPLVPGLRRGQPARAALPRAGRLRVHGPDGGRARRDRPRRGRAGPVAAALLLRAGRQEDRQRRSRGQRRTGPPMAKQRSVQLRGLDLD